MVKLLRHAAAAFTLVLWFGTLYTLTYPASGAWHGLPRDEDTGVWMKFFNRLYISTGIISTSGLGPVAPKALGARCLVFAEMLAIVFGIVSIASSSR